MGDLKAALFLSTDIDICLPYVILGLVDVLHTIFIIPAIRG